MKKLLILALLLNAALLAGRLWQEMPAIAQVGGGDPACEQDRTLHSIDSNADGNVNLSDAVHLLQWLFSGGPEPQVCLAQTSLEARVAALEATVGTLNKGLTSLDARVAAVKGTALTEEQREILGHLSIVQLPVDEQGNTAKTIRFTGVNVQVVNGLGATNGFPGDPLSRDPAQTTTNGLGNLVVGYNERRPGAADDRTGSHNIAVGSLLNYRGFGGLIVGRQNTIAGAYSSVSGGTSNTARDESCSVSGGQANTASFFASSVSGGLLNRASGADSSVSGGRGNEARGFSSSVSGGRNNEARGVFSSVSGGGGNEKGQGNTAAGDFSTVSGGRNVTVQGVAGHAP